MTIRFAVQQLDAIRSKELLFFSILEGKYKIDVTMKYADSSTFNNPIYLRLLNSIKNLTTNYELNFEHSRECDATSMC